MIWKIAIGIIAFAIIGGYISNWITDRKAARIIKERDNLNLKTAYGRQERDRLNAKIDKLYGFR